MINIPQISEELSRKTDHPMKDWQAALVAAIHDVSFSQMTDGEILRVIGAVKSPEHLTHVLEMFQAAYGELQTMPFDLLWPKVCGSHHDLSEWLLALETLFVQSRERGKAFGFAAMVEDVSQDCGALTQGQTLAAAASARLTKG